MFKVICAWCDEDMGTKAGLDGDTHGICPRCFKIEMAKWKAAA